MATLSKDLGGVTAYAAAVNRGYTGTREEFETLMASYATVAQNAAESASTASTAAATATSAANTATTKASEASVSADAASASAATATTKAGEAETSAAAASTAKDDAVTAKNEAVAAKDAAVSTAADFTDTAEAAVTEVNLAGQNQKELARAQALNSEAWAVGQRDGADVGVADDTYHNNAKYYATQAGASATAAATSESNAAASATSAAASASAAAQSAASLTVDSALSSTSTNPVQNKVVKESISDLNNHLNSVYEGYVPINPTYIFDGTYITNGRLGTIANHATYCYALENGKEYTVRSSTRKISYGKSNTLFSGSGFWFYSNFNNQDIDSTSFENGENYSYLYVYAHSADTDFGISVYETLLEETKEGLESLENDVDRLRILKATFSEVELTSIVADKYLYGVSGDSSDNGTAQTSSSMSYAKVDVVAGDKYSITGLAKQFSPIVLYYKGTSINHTSYAGSLEIVSENKTYKDYVFEIPGGVTRIGINIPDNVTVTLKKFTSTENVKYLYDLNVNSFGKTPMDYLGSEISVFDKILCLGDSLTAGGFNNPDITPDPSHATRTVESGTYSYPKILKKMYGVDYTTMALSGSTSTEWLAEFGSQDWSGHDCAIVFIGTNDRMFVDNQGMTVEQAVATNLQNLQTIISKLQTDNYGIPIFLCTVFYNWGDAHGVSGGVNANIRNLCQSMPGVYCIDFNRYSDFTVASGWTYTHPVAIGYREMARQIAACIGWTINNNRADFKWIQFVGTEYAVAIGS